MPVNDPWNGKFEDFKARYKGSLQEPDPPGNLGHPHNAVFKVSDLQTLIDLQGARNIVFYPVSVETTVMEQMMVAVAIDINHNRLPSPQNSKYAFSIHNCPPNCRGDAEPMFRKINLMFEQ